MNFLKILSLFYIYNKILNFNIFQIGYIFYHLIKSNFKKIFLLFSISFIISYNGKILNINNKETSKIILYLVFSIPALLITGPFLPDLTLTILSFSSCLCAKKNPIRIFL